MLTQLRTRAQITLPKDFVKRLGLKEGDNLDIQIEDDKIVIKPVLIIDKSQAWFWSKEWQEEEKEVDEEIKAGKIKTAKNLDELMKDLRDEN